MNITFTGPNGLTPEAHFAMLQAAAFPTVGLARQIASSQIQRIKERTTHGYTVEGDSFAAYSPKYAVWKEKHGGSGVVDLYGATAGARMMETLTMQIEGQQYVDSSPGSDNGSAANSVDIGFFEESAIELRARLHNEGGGRMPRRRFLGMSDADLAAATTEAGRYIEQRIEQADHGRILNLSGSALTQLFNL